MQIKDKFLAILRILAVCLLLFIIPVIVVGFIAGALRSPTMLPVIVNLPVIVINIINLTIYLPSLLFILLGCFVVSKIYKIKVHKLGMLFTKHWIKNVGLGIGIGTLSITTVWLLSILFGGYTITINNLDQTVLIGIVFGFLASLMVGYSEEVMTRGLMTFVGVKNNKLFNAIIVGLLFSLMHLLSPSFNILSMINTLLVAIVFSMLTWISGDLWVAIGYHAIWNFILGNIFGISVSGNLSGKALLISLPSSSDLISGGEYGLEASLVFTMFLLIQIAFIYVLFIKKGKTNKEPVAPWLA